MRARKHRAEAGSASRASLRDKRPRTHATLVALVRCFSRWVSIGQRRVAPRLEGARQLRRRSSGGGLCPTPLFPLADDQNVAVRMMRNGVTGAAAYKSSEEVRFSPTNND